jgi:hypothetical protein
MKRFIQKSKKWLWLPVIAFLVTGCAPGPPPPPVFPGFEWFIIAVLVMGAGILLWRKLDVSKPPKEDHLTEVLNEMNRQLKKLEEKLDNLEKISKKPDEKNENNKN